MRTSAYGRWVQDCRIADAVLAFPAFAPWLLSRRVAQERRFRMAMWLLTGGKA
jgi:hypothetical protein